MSIQGRDQQGGLFRWVAKERKMADVSDIEQKLNVLKFEASLLGSSNPDFQKKQKAIAQLERDLAFAKLRQGSNT